MADAEKTKTKRGGKLSIALMIIVCLIAIVFLKMTFVLFIVGMLPAIVVYIVDISESRSLFHTVTACNLSGVMPFVGKLWAAGNDTSEVGYALSDMQTLFIMYLSAALGWGLMYVCPIAARLLIAAINERNILRLKHKQRRLMEEWGKDIANPIVE